MPSSCPIRPSRAGLRRRKGTRCSPLLGIKNQIFLITLVDRATRCCLGFRAVWQRSREVLQEWADEAPKARRDYRDACEGSERLRHHGGRYAVSQDETDTYACRRE